MGAGIHLGAISKDEEIAIKYYIHLPVLLHDIDPKVDMSRHLLARQVAQSTAYQVLGHAPLAAAVPDGVTADYETDGKVLVIVRKGEQVAPDLLKCLQLA